VCLFEEVIVFTLTFINELKKVKIVHLVNNLERDGSGNVVMWLCSLLCKDKYEISVVSLTPDVPLSASAEWPGHVHVYTFRYNYDDDYSLRRYLLLYLNKGVTKRNGAEIIHCIQRLSPDILHCHLQPRELVLAMVATRNIKTVLLYTDHSKRLSRGQYTPFKLNVLAWILRQILKQFHVVAVSTSVWMYHREFSLINKNRFHGLIVNRVDTTIFVPNPQSSDCLKVIYVARLNKRKGHDTLVKAWAAIKSVDSKIELVLVGGGDMDVENELRSLVRILRPQNPVIFVGPVEHVLPYLQSSHIGVFPSLQEGLPLSLLEMMSCGLPVIASDIDELKAIITDGKDGILFKTDDPDDLFQKLWPLLNDEGLREQLGKRARELVVNHYSIDGLKEDYENVYNKIIS